MPKKRTRGRPRDDRICSKCGQTISLPHTIGGRITQKRIERGYSQKDVGDRLGCSPSHVSWLELDKCSPRLNEMVSIAKFLKTDLNYFLEYKKGE
tara:strand:+ start:59 stop:343 length:285 start_codon:yes stop_codon:yes gene_type:complete